MTSSSDLTLPSTESHDIETFAKESLAGAEELGAAALALRRERIGRLLEALPENHPMMPALQEADNTLDRLRTRALGRAAQKKRVACTERLY